MQTSKDFLHIFLDMGDALLNSGAEIFRVEDTLNRMGYACGAAQMNVFVITSSIVITMEFPGEGARPLRHPPAAKGAADGAGRPCPSGGFLRGA